MNPNTASFVFAILFGALLLAFVLIITNISSVETKVPAQVIENCIGLELESNKRYHRVPIEILTYCLEKD